jgi:hypothetical protein
MTSSNVEEVPGLRAVGKTAKLHYVSDSKPGITRVRTSAVAMEAMSLMRKRWYVSASRRFPRRMSKCGQIPMVTCRHKGATRAAASSIGIPPLAPGAGRSDGTMPSMPPSDKRSPNF